MAGLLDFITEAAKKQYAQGAPYRQAVTGLLQGDTSKANTLLDRGIESLRTPEGAMDVALNFSPMMLGTFIGKNSKLWNSSKADIAQQLEKAGVAPEEIWKQTGTVRGVDGKLRQEISDVGSKMIKKPTLDVLKKNPEMSSIMEHPELYSAYDNLSSAKVVPSYESQGFYRMEDNSIGMSPMNESANWQMKMYKDAKKKTLLHEGQHAIQAKEGFAKGGSPQDFPSSQDINDAQIVASLIKKGSLPSEAKKWVQNNLGRNPSVSAMDLAMKKDVDLFNIPSDVEQYKKLAGEAESRLTEARRDLSPAQRLQYFPYSQGQYGLDVPYESLIVRGLLE
jgi:hypothetical protein